MYLLYFIEKIIRKIKNIIDRIHCKYILIKNSVDYSQTTIFIGVPFIVNNGIFKIMPKTKIVSKYSYNPIGGQTFSSFVIKNNAELIIDEGAKISNVSIYCSRQIVIGKNVYIGGDCKIYDTDFHSIQSQNRIDLNDNNIISKPIKINDRVFVGAATIILKGVEIGNNSVIGAGSVVTKNIPPNQVWGGNPAKFIKHLDTLE